MNNPAPSAADPWMGRVIAEKYRILRRLGAGGHSVVFEAEHTWTGRHVALKVLLGAAALHPEMSERFLREARATTRVAHPHIVEVLDMGRDPNDGTLFIVQELLHGEDLRHLLRREHTLDPQRLIAFLVPVLDALTVAHAQGIVHRDLKPANLYLARQPNGHILPKLIDFGVSRMDDTPGVHELTHAGALLGTPDYMSPEQARGERVDARSDVWAIGVMLFEALSGRRPYQAAHCNALLVQIIADPAPPLRSVAPTVPLPLAAVVDRALAHDPHDRFPSAAALRDALLACSTAPAWPTISSPEKPPEPFALPTSHLDSAPGVDDPTPVSVEPPAMPPELPSTARSSTSDPPEHVGTLLTLAPAMTQAGTVRSTPAAWVHRPAPSKTHSLVPWVLSGMLSLTLAIVAALRMVTHRHTGGSSPPPVASPSVPLAEPSLHDTRLARTDTATLSPEETPGSTGAPRMPMISEGMGVLGPDPSSPPALRPASRSRPSARPTPPPPVLERPTPLELRRVMLSAGPAVARCVNHREGVVRVQLTIQGTGTVDSVTIEPPWGGTPAAACVALVLRGLRFTPFRQPRFQLTWPYVVQPASPSPTLQGAHRKPARRAFGSRSEGSCAKAYTSSSITA